MPAATAFALSRTIACASTAAVVPSPARSGAFDATLFSNFLEFDFLRNRYAVLGDARGPKTLLKHNVATLRSQRHYDGMATMSTSTEHLLSGLSRESYRSEEV